MYDKYWIKEWDKEKYRLLKWIYDLLDGLYLFVRAYWMYAIVFMIGVASLMKYFESIPKGSLFFGGDYLYLLISIVMPLIFGLGLESGQRVGYC